MAIARFLCVCVCVCACVRVGLRGGIGAYNTKSAGGQTGAPSGKCGAGKEPLDRRISLNYDMR